MKSNSVKIDSCQRQGGRKRPAVSPLTRGEKENRQACSYIARPIRDWRARVWKRKQFLIRERKKGEGSIASDGLSRARIALEEPFALQPRKKKKTNLPSPRQNRWDRPPKGRIPRLGPEARFLPIMKNTNKRKGGGDSFIEGERREGSGLVN